MRLLQVTIKNFRGFRQDTIRLGGHIALVGENNSGKSTILDAIRRPLDPDPPLHDISEFDFHGREFTGNPIAIEVVVGDLGAAKDAFREQWEPWDKKRENLITEADDPAIFDLPDTETVVRFGYRAWWDSSEEHFREQHYYPKSTTEDDPEQAELSRAADRRRVPFFIVPFPRDARRLMDLTRQSPLSQLLTARQVSLEPKLLEIVKRLESVGDYLYEDAAFRSVIDDIVTRLSSLVPLDAERPLRLHPLPEARFELPRSFQAVVRLATDPVALPLAHHGGGLRNAAAAAVLLCLAAMREDFIVAFEEPEVSLHPALQRHFVGEMRSLAAQLLVTTHSEHVAERFAADEFRIVRFSPERRVVIPNLAPDERRWALHWSSKVGRAVFASAVVLVEGMGDELAFRGYARLMREGQARRGTTSTQPGADFDSLNWAVIEGGGDEIDHVARVLAEFGLPLAAVVDGDAAGDKYLDRLVALGVSVVQLPRSCEVEDLLASQASTETLRRFITQARELGRPVPDPAPLAEAELRDEALKLLRKARGDQGMGLFTVFVGCTEPTEIPLPVCNLLETVLRDVTPGCGIAVQMWP